MNLSVIGLGKLGACAAACFAHRGFPTVGVDVNPATVAAINAGVAPVVEPRLQELISAAGGRLCATNDYRRAIAESEVSFLIVPTPSLPDGSFSDRFVRSVLSELALAFRHSGKAYHLFVVTSTVSPGTTAGSLIPLIESVSGRRLNRDFGVCYNPEFIALGNVIEGSLRPDLVLIGESDARAGDTVEAIYRQTCENQPTIARMSIVSAEIAKISVNSYVTMKISYANTLAGICEQVPGAEIDAITRALGADRRISPHYLKGGLSFGGPCFPRDNRAFVAFARNSGCEAPLAEATDRVNIANTDRIVERILTSVKSQEKVALLGLSFKPHTPVIEESPALRMAEALVANGLQVTVYDPLAMDNAKVFLGDKVTYAASVAECVADATLCLIPTPWPEFRAVEQLAHNPMTIIDCWRFLDPGKLKKGVKYVAVGYAS